MATEKNGVVTKELGSSPVELACENHLLPQHVEDLARSGITVQQALAEGIQSLSDPKAIASILNWERPTKAIGPCLLFSFRGGDGQLLPDYARLKPDRPRAEKKGTRNGKTIKYESPVGRPNRVYFPSGTMAALADVSVPLIITEGEKKALKATLCGFPCIGLVGVWGWQQKREKDADGRGTGERKLIPDLDAIAWEGRLVYLIFDSDAARKQEVQFAETAFAEVLLQRGAKVIVVRLPESSGADSQPVKVGLDDYLVAHPAEDLKALLDAAAPFVRALPTTEGPAAGRTLVDGWELTESGYSAHAGRTFRCEVECDEDGVPHITKKTRLANFAAHISGETILDDGAEKQRELEITVERYGRAPVSTAIPVERFGTLDWVVEQFGPQHVIQPGNGKRDHLRCAIQELSGPDIKSTVVYGHTGFREIDGRWYYLHGDGAIGSEGVVSGVKVHLEGNAALYRLPAPPTGIELINCVRASLGILNGLAPDAIVFPLVASTYRAPLGAPDFSPWFSGFTGQGKSELLALGQQHYGRDMTRLRLPGNWTSTDNALEGMAFVVKDALFGVDDFCPAGAKNDHERMHRIADRLLRAQGNHSGRQRMRADGTLRPPKPPRGLIAATGEDIPRGLSLAARLGIIEVQRNTVNFARLSECQREAAVGLYAGAMAGYVRWLAANYQEVQVRLHDERVELRNQFLQVYPHNRTPDVIANLLIGLRYILRFAEHSGAIDQQERAHLWGRGQLAFRAIGKGQEEHQRAADPVARFSDLVCTIIASGRGHIAGPDGVEPGLPPSPESWGWEGRQFRSGTDETSINYVGRGHKIGWVVDEELYLDSDATFAALVELTRDQNVPFPLTQPTLCRRLKEAGHLLRTEKDRTTYPVTLEGARRSVLIFSAPLLLQKPGQPGQERPSPGSAEPSVPVSCPGFAPSAEKPGQEKGANNRENSSFVPVVPVVPVSGGGGVESFASCNNHANGASTTRSVPPKQKRGKV